LLGCVPNMTSVTGSRGVAGHHGCLGQDRTSIEIGPVTDDICPSDMLGDLEGNPTPVEVKIFGDDTTVLEGLASSVEIR